MKNRAGYLSGLVAVLAFGCGDSEGPQDFGIITDGAIEDTTRSDVVPDTAVADTGPSDTATTDMGAPMDVGVDRGPPRDSGPVEGRGSIRWVLNGTGAHDYGRQLELPPEFGVGEFTLDMWIRPDDSYPFGTTEGGEEQLRNWETVDNRPYESGTWWYQGNFLLDGHNNRDGFDLGTFSLQFYGSGRIRWLFGDGAVGESGGVWNAGAYPATAGPNLVDGSWHHVAAVRRYSGDSATIELWVDGTLVDSEERLGQVNMRRFWDTWPGFGEAQAGWFWGAEKQAAIGALEQYEDYKGLMGELRFWSRALDRSELSDRYDVAIDGSESGLVGWFPFDEGTGDMACDALDRRRCMTVSRAAPDFWSAETPPLR